MRTIHPVRCQENEPLVAHFLSKRQELADCNAVSENLDLTLSIAYRNIAACKTPILTIKDLSRIKGVGKWILRHLQDFFSNNADTLKQTGTNDSEKEKKSKVPRRYVPQKNSVAYALVITLYRALLNGKDFMAKQELIDAAEGSGLSRTSIAQEKGIGKPGQIGNSPRNWYTGWSCMKTLVVKGLVAKSSCPAKYMLTEEGKETARDCLIRSGLVDPFEFVIKNSNLADPRCTLGSSEPELNHASISQKEVFLPADSNQRISSLIEPSGRLMQNLQTGILESSDSIEVLEEDNATNLSECNSTGFGNNIVNNKALFCEDFMVSTTDIHRPPILQPCTSFDHPACEPSSSASLEVDSLSIAMPRKYGEKFEDTYDVILILDDRENFGSCCKRVVDMIRSQFKIQVEARRLPVGDATWIARHRYLGDEYVLDFIIERKRVDDLRMSIRDNRYRDQKLRLLRCGLQKLIYLVEGDPNACEAAESIKTACFTTEILEGFDVQITSGLTETVRKYGHLTQAIIQYYNVHFSKNSSQKLCPSYKEFVKRCQNLEKMTISDVFALQLMQVPYVTEEVALAVLDMYPTLVSLVEAYKLLEGNIRAQEEMLKNKNNLIPGAASRNIFKLVWAD